MPFYKSRREDRPWEYNLQNEWHKEQRKCTKFVTCARGGCKGTSGVATQLKVCRSGCSTIFSVGRSYDNCYFGKVGGIAKLFTDVEEHGPSR